MADTKGSATIDPRLVRKLADILTDTGLSEIEVEQEGLRIRVARELTVSAARGGPVRVPLEVAMKRILTGRAGLKYYEAGMDLGLSEDPEDSFRLFQARILEEYEKMIPEFDLTVVDATLPIEEQQEQMRQHVRAKLAQAKRLRVAP